MLLARVLALSKVLKQPQQQQQHGGGRMHYMSGSGHKDARGLSRVSPGLPQHPSPLSSAEPVPALLQRYIGGGSSGSTSTCPPAPPSRQPACPSPSAAARQVRSRPPAWQPPGLRRWQSWQRRRAAGRSRMSTRGPYTCRHDDCIQRALFGIATRQPDSDHQYPANCGGGCRVD
jgi:hypothetical protein